ncbi:epimerase family protein [Oleiphilus messinensis]|uniref:Epimerase family protein n=1 Tax=Oleiphilus messinensis TaxID=141451 RepID=A0A1Y0I7T4_9GAMM|nr:TIGR01777 family oxidoreductase [Oleiphilus messinensis]ARU56558.1 epimerase family protein [Oleiphilus messinensis]
MRNILITGGTGFIGKQLCHHLSEQGFTLTVLSRQNPETIRSTLPPNTRIINSLSKISASESIAGIINLAGEPIADKRWSETRKALIKESRIATTQKIISLMQRLSEKPDFFISGSAAGYYGDQKNQSVDENTPPVSGFTHDLCAEWEQTAQQAAELGIRTCILRTGLVVGKSGGFLSKMLPPFKFGMGGPMGPGTQWMPWIHQNDITSIILWLISNPNTRGIYNLTAPHPVTNQEFARCLGKVLRRPAILPIPEFILRLIFGEMAILFLEGQKATPHNLLQQGYVFEFEYLEDALNDATRN